MQREREAREAFEGGGPAGGIRHVAENITWEVIAGVFFRIIGRGPLKVAVKKRPLSVKKSKADNHRIP